MEAWLETLIAGWGSEIVFAVIGAAVTATLGFLWHRKPIKAMQQELAELREWKEPHELQPATQRTPERPSDSDDQQESSVTVDYIGACGIVRAYILPALAEMPERVRVGVVHGFVERFGKTTGAMLGEGQYNRERLRQWIESNAARFLIDHRDEMR